MGIDYTNFLLFLIIKNKPMIYYEEVHLIDNMSVLCLI